MKTYIIDFETYYAKDFTLRQMTPIEYILDARFQTIGAAVGRDGFFGWLEEDQIKKWLARLPEKCAMISHNASFDMSILAHRFGYVPALMVDTLALSRAWWGDKLKSHSLAKVAEYCGFDAKGTTVQNVIGMRLEDIKRMPGLYKAYQNYSIHDAELTYQIYNRIMKEGFPRKELVVLDSVIRCCVDPKFQLDNNALLEHQNRLQVFKQSLLTAAGLDNRESLMSNEKFANALRMLGIEPPTKTSLATGQVTYAFAKTDPAFMELEEHEDDRVQALVAARLGTKSTIEETRTQRFINIAKLPWSDGYTAKMPIPLRYSGAHTHRLSGDWKLNLQNLPRGGALRKALRAPKGHLVVAGDSSQIEARLVAWFSGQQDLVDAFARGEDIYSMFASDAFGRPVNKKENPSERFVGKTAVLGLGFGLGWNKFQTAIKMQSKAQTGTQIVLTDEEAMNIVNTYRSKYSNIPVRWRRNDWLIAQMTNPDCHIVDGPITIMHEKIKLPNGLYLYYTDLKQVDGEWTFTYGGMRKKLYGGKLMENIIQALARCCTMDTGKRMRRDHGLHFALQVHDELVYIVPEDDAPRVKTLLLDELCKRPLWAPNLPLAADAEIGPTYGDAK